MAKSHRGGRGIVLDITEEIINLALPRDSSHCVIADALKAAVPEARFVSVDLQTIRWTDPATGRRYIYLTPAPLQRLLVNFDQGERPEPFAARLGQPAQIARSGIGRRRAASKKAVAAGNRTITTPNVDGKVPVVVGGHLPPTAALSSTRGRRRAFGLRSLAR